MKSFEEYLKKAAEQDDKPSVSKMTEATNTATRVNQKLPKFTLATAAKYKLDPPYKNPHDHRNRSYQYVILSTTHVPHTGWETYVFPADATGTAPVSWTELPASTRGTTEPRNTLTDINNPLSHVAVLKDMGYTLR